VETITIDGVALPCLGRHGSVHGYGFVVPMENGWNAYVIGYPRPDETEFAVACLTRHEADRVVAGEWGIGSELTDWNKRPDNAWPRGEYDLLQTLRDLAEWPSPEIGVGV
jgi:hypothetical protein